ncbi:MAG: DJ-1/PfpI family protein [Clostridia bacterium]|nr:DJ-1/PfpI family protein [Clostridia bacterium]
MKVMILALKGFEMLEFSAFADVLGWAKLEGGLDIEYDTAGFSREVRSTFDVPITVDRFLWRRGAGVCCPVDICEGDYDALAIPGGFEEYGYYEEAYRDETTMLIRAFHKAGKPIASICVGALALGNSGVLEGRKATTYTPDGSNRQTPQRSHQQAPQLSHRQKQLAAFGADVQAGERIVIDGNLITSCGPSTATDVAFLLLQKLTDAESAEKVRKLMGFE